MSDGICTGCQTTKRGIRGKLKALATWASGVGRTSCKVCRSVHDTPPCEKCFPGVHEYNAPIFRLYNEVAGQYIMGMDGAVDIDLKALIWIMEKLGVHESEQLAMSSAVRTFNSLVLAEITEEQKRVSKSGKA